MLPIFFVSGKMHIGMLIIVILNSQAGYFKISAIAELDAAVSSDGVLPLSVP